MLVKYGVIEGNDAFFYDGDAFGEEFIGKCSGAYRVSKEAEAVGEFDRDSAVVSVGWGVVKNVAIVLAIDRPSSGLEA